ncbi:MAG TPA: O-antigen ligase family protein [Bdellovibrionales bacterium]|nr:O-antigen ligase family protein [Bdellovibrionales bacterium]
MPLKWAPRSFLALWIIVPALAHPALSPEQFYESRNAIYFLIALIGYVLLAKRSALDAALKLGHWFWAFVLVVGSILISWAPGIPNDGLFLLAAAIFTASFIFLSLFSHYDFSLDDLSLAAALLLLIATTNGLAYAFAGVFPLDFIAKNFSLGAPVGPKSFVSILAVQLIPVILLGELRKFGGARVLLLRASVFCGMLYICLMRSRTAWVALGTYSLICIFILIFKRGAATRQPAVVFLALFTAAVVSVATIPTKLKWSSSAPYRQSLETIGSLEASSGRDELWKIAGLMFKAEPILGVGAGQYPALFAKYALEPTVDRTKFQRGFIPSSSNDFIQAFAERGLLGGFAYLAWALLLPALYLARAAFRAKPFQWAPVLLLLSSIGGTISAMFNGVAPNMFLLLNFLLTTALALKLLDTAPARAHVTSARNALWISAPFALLLAVLTARLLAGQASYEYVRNFTLVRRADDQAKVFKVAKFSYAAWPWAYHWNDQGFYFGGHGFVMDHLNFGRAEDAKDFVAGTLARWPEDRRALHVAAGYEFKTKNYDAAAGYFRRAFLPIGKDTCDMAVGYTYFKFLTDPERPPNVALTNEELGPCASYVERVLKNPKDA